MGQGLPSTEQCPPWIGQCVGSAQVVIGSGNHVQNGAYGVGLHASPVTEQFWPRVGQSAVVEHASSDALQWPSGSGGQSVGAPVQAAWETTHAPGWSGHSLGS